MTNDGSAHGEKKRMDIKKPGHVFAPAKRGCLKIRITNKAEKKPEHIPKKVQQPHFTNNGIDNMFTELY
ncbi:MAG: hypothetical protein BRD50_08820 [Bacteroidetes bacterium SW_11_45_7]|nr:MAG: hypothetical protein BRD50_08820 [Bacteroidetes bacterium SW_11_45_7]